MSECPSCGQESPEAGMCSSCLDSNFARDYGSRFLYTPLRNGTPRYSWVNDCPDDVDPRSEENPYLFTYKEVREIQEDRPSLEFIAAWTSDAGRANNMPHVAILDIDKGDDHAETSELDIAELDIDDNLIVVETPSGGWHIHLPHANDTRVSLNVPDGVDHVGTTNKALFGMPFFMDGYSFKQEGNRKARWDQHLEDQDKLNQILDTDSIQVEDPNDYTTSNIEIPSSAPEELPKCLSELLSIRSTPNIDTRYDNAYEVNQHTGQLFPALGFEKEKALSYFKKYPPDGRIEKYDERVTQRHLDTLYRKTESGNLHPPTVALAKNGIDIDACDCAVHEKFGKQTNPRLHDFIPVDEYGHPKIHDNVNIELDSESNQIIISLARSGKSYAVCRAIARLYRGGFDGNVVFIGPTHTECRATLDKLRHHSHGDYSIGMLVGMQSARNAGLSASGDHWQGDLPKTIEEAKRIVNDKCNQYQALVEGTQEADVVVTVPELVERFDDYNVLACCEESAMKRLTTSTFKLLNAQPRYDGTDQIVWPITSYKDDFERIRDDIQGLERTQGKHRAVLNVVQAALRMIRLIEEFEILTWGELHATIINRLDEIEDALQCITDELDHKYVKNNISPHLHEVFFNVAYFDGFLRYGDVGVNQNTGNLHHNEIQVHGVSEQHATVEEICPDAAFWFAGFDKNAIEDTFEAYDREPPEAFAFKAPDWMTNTSRIYKYTGGDNPSQQTGHMRELGDAIQRANQNITGMAIAGSSQRAAQHSKTTMGSYLPKPVDTEESIKKVGKAGMQLKVAETSKYCTGIDMEWMQYNIVEHGFYATPFEDYHDDGSLKIGKKLSSLQNATLRAANVKSGGTGITPHVIPSRHCPSVIFDIFKAFGLTVQEIGDLDKLKKVVIRDINENTNLDLVIDEQGEIRKREDVTIVQPLSRLQESNADD